MNAALIQELRHGLMADFSEIDFPSKVYGFKDDTLVIKEAGTAFGYVWNGMAHVTADGRAYTLPKGSFFSLPASFEFEIVGGIGFIAYRLGYLGLTLTGRHTEVMGRLKYIDGCSDTLLIAPPLKGDPCFNFLHFPKGIKQTQHTHPSIRAGLIHSGAGWCNTATGREELTPGSMFILYPDAIHGFETDESGMSLTVFHPDSDFGPTHEEHPMLNRTIVDGVSAKEIDSIRTQTITA
jgi:quercetin dioxygenase-like cupin family protein